MAKCCAAFAEAETLDFFDLREGHGAPDGMAKKGAGMNGFALRGRPRGVHEIDAAHARGEREAAGEGFAQAEEVRHSTAVLAGEPFARAAKAGIDFIGNEPCAKPVTKPPKQGQKFTGRNHDAAAGLDGFDQNAAGLAALQDFFDFVFQSGQVRMAFGKGNELAKLPELGVKGAAEEVAMSDVERAVAESMIAAGEGDDAAFAGGENGGFQRGFHGLKTGIAKDGFGAAGPAFKSDAAQFAGEFGFARMGMNVTHGVKQTGHLLLAGFDDVRIGVAGGGDAKGAGQIEMFFARGVPNENAAGAFPDHRPGAVPGDIGDVARFKITQQMQGFSCSHQFKILDLRFA